jgi:Zn-dependent protease
MFDRGYITVARYRGAPIKLHWSLLLGLLWVSGLAFLPGAWAGYVLVILLHEMGHAYLARRYGLAVKEIMLHGLGGHCAYVGYPTPWQRSVIASGGVSVQALLLAIFVPLYLLLPSGGANQAAFFSVMVFTNLFLILFNLIPIAPLDGHEIAKLPALYRKRKRELGMRAMEQAETDRARISRMARARGGLETELDDRAVKDLVKKALDDAKRAAKERSN